MTPYYKDDLITLHHGDCLEVLATLPEASVDAIVTDPPYALGFMGKTWDKQPDFQDWCRMWAVECLRVLKPGGHMLAFGGTRTWHRLACGVEDAGFELRDQIAWLYANGVPKSLDVAKAIDKESNNSRARKLEFTEWMRSTGITAREINEATGTRTGNRYLSSKQQPAIPTEAIFDKLRPILPKVPARIEKLVTERSSGKFSAFARRTDRKVVKRNIDNQATDFDLRVVNAGTPVLDEAKRWQGWGTALKPAFEPCIVARKPLVGTVADNVLAYGTGAININATRVNGTDGRWPPNLTIDGHVAADLDVTTPGGRSRFFPTFRFEVRAPTRERPKVNGVAHPTVKPLALMRWLVRLVTQPGGTVLDPFAGSGTTLEAAVLEGFNAIGIEREETYLPLIMQRLRRIGDVPFNFEGGTE
ncbi:hypothetical protein HMPREF9241_01680 [Schaalia turicensis ACS-279-V-Col4]|uniref:Methyltransferase n=1 Tax=Schaalia turicensis ACS-279-V-Col4 TaxID=883077 RepID=K0YYZ7_9ACTO|nr:site-specific DNA-methyltransferase [Schaalia turicensis]EJZ84904.1 hypothetical protein HMPREF9241_01680 [Schaalia turicensis ACS-279-V-Col4]